MANADVLSKRAHDDSPSPTKRLRTHQDNGTRMNGDSGRLRLKDLPKHTLRKIVHDVVDDTNHPGSIEHGPVITSMASLRLAAPLLLTCRALARAFYEHVKAISFEEIEYDKLQKGLVGILPKFSKLSTLKLANSNADWRLVDQWDQFFQRSQAKIRILGISLTRSQGPLCDPVIKTIARGCSPSLRMFEFLSAAPDGSNILATIGEHCGTITGLKFRCVGVDLRVLANFTKLQCLDALVFRTTAEGIRKMNWALSHAHDLRLVRLRLHTCDFGNELGSIREVPQLQKLSLFGCQFAGSLSALAYAPSLTDVELEWLEQVNDFDIDDLTRNMGRKLSRLALRNCPLLTDRALTSIASNCPEVYLDIPFDNVQFSAGAMNLFANSESSASVE